MLDELGPTSELHVIDPLPQFDPADHERRFPGRYVFHHGISHDVLPTLEPADVVLVDGDHNWYTVHGELQLLAKTARDAAAPLPVLVLHDVGWPYGRRDLYYEPSRIPDEHRQPHRQAGMQHGVSALRGRGGMNADLDNAEHEGGPRTGSSRRSRTSSPSTTGRCGSWCCRPTSGSQSSPRRSSSLATRPCAASSTASTRSRASEASSSSASGSDSTRPRSPSSGSVGSSSGSSGAPTRYLGTVKAALLDEHYLENELRIEHLRNQLGQPDPDLAPLRDPARLLPVRYQKLVAARTAGTHDADEVTVAPFPYADMGRAQLDRIEHGLGALHAGAVGGDIAEIGGGRAGGAIFAAGVPGGARDQGSHGLGGRSLHARPTPRGRVRERPHAGAGGLRPVRPARRAGPLRAGETLGGASPGRRSTAWRSCAWRQDSATSSAPP